MDDEAKSGRTRIDRVNTDAPHTSCASRRLHRRCRRATRFGNARLTRARLFPRTLTRAREQSAGVEVLNGLGSAGRWVNICMETAFDWKPECEELARLFIEQHFGGPQGLTSVFPCMRNEYPWGADRPAVTDSRVTAKNNTEYHGLERHASQCNATAQYEYAYHHWLLAAYWRRGDAEANNFVDPSHEKAVRNFIKQALYRSRPI